MIPRTLRVPPPKQSTPYVPAKFGTVTNGSTLEFEFTGRSGNTFGFDRILPGAASGMNDLTATAVLNEDFTLFSDIKLSVLKAHFQSMRLLFPFIIQRNNTLKITLSNDTGGDIEAGIQLPGYDAPYLNALIQKYQEKGIKPPRPILLHAAQNIDASATAEEVVIKTKSVDMVMVRATVKTDDDASIRFSTQVYNETVKNKVFVDEFNDEYENAYANVPFIIGKNVPLSLTVENLDASAYDLCFFGEAYVLED